MLFAPETHPGSQDVATVSCASACGKAPRGCRAGLQEPFGSKSPGALLLLLSADFK